MKEENDNSMKIVYLVTSKGSQEDIAISDKIAVVPTHRFIFNNNGV